MNLSSLSSSKFQRYEDSKDCGPSAYCQRPVVATVGSFSLFRLGLFFSLWSLSGKIRIRIPRSFEFRRDFDHRRFRIFHSFWDFSIRDRIYPNRRTTKGFESVRAGTRITTNDDVSLESFSNSSNRSVFFRSEKAEDF